MGSHDQNFKNFFVDFLREWLLFLAHGEASRIPPDAVLTAVRQETQNDAPGDKVWETDVPVTATWGDTVFVFILEQESRRMTFESLCKKCVYCARKAMENGTKHVIPIIVYTFTEFDGEEVLELKGFGKTYLRMECITVSLPKLLAADYRESGNIVARILTPLMKNSGDELPQSVFCALAAVAGLKDDNLRRKYAAFVAQYSDLDSKAMEKLNSICEKSGYPREQKEGFMSLLDYLTNKGRVEGLAEGIAKGQVKYIMDLMHDSVIMPAQARVQLIALRKKHPECEQFADLALAEIGDRE